MRMHTCTHIHTVSFANVCTLVHDRWEPMLGCLSMGLLTSLRNEQTQHLCQLMKVLEHAPDYIMVIHHLLRGAFTLLLRATNIKVRAHRSCAHGTEQGGVLRGCIEGKASSSCLSFIGRTL